MAQLGWTQREIREHLEIRIDEIKNYFTKNYKVFFDGECCDALKDHVESSIYADFWKAFVRREKESFTIELHNDHKQQQRDFGFSRLQQE